MVGVILKQRLTTWLELYGSASTLTLNFRQKSAKNPPKWLFLPNNGYVLPPKIFLLVPKAQPSYVRHSEPIFDPLA